jgi:hypothetical protein
LLVGDDDDALEVLAELSRHLDYAEVSRLDEAPEQLGSEDHLVIGQLDATRGARLLESALRRGAPALYLLVPDARTPGARAILAAAQLVSVATAPQ